MTDSPIKIGDFCQLNNAFGSFISGIKLSDVLIVIDISTQKIRPEEIRVKFYNVTQNKKHIHVYNATAFIKL